MIDYIVVGILGFIVWNCIEACICFGAIIGGCLTGLTDWSCLHMKIGKERLNDYMGEI